MEKKFKKLIWKIKKTWNNTFNSIHRETRLESLLRFFCIFYAAMLIAIVALIIDLGVNQSKINEALMAKNNVVAEQVSVPNKEEIVIESMVANTVKEVEEPSIIVLEKPEEPEEPEGYQITEADIELMARLTWCEAGNQCEEGKRLVIDTILNRLDDSRFPDTIEGVIYQKNQYSPMWNGAFEKSVVHDDIYQLVLEEIDCRLNDEVIFFRTNRYHKWGVPMFQIGAHYFSSY